MNSASIGPWLVLALVAGCGGPGASSPADLATATSSTPGAVDLASASPSPAADLGQAAPTDMAMSTSDMRTPASDMAPVLTPSGPITAQSGMTYSGLKITNPSGPCITLTNVTNVHITGCEIGPCGGGVDSNGVTTTGSSQITIDHNYIHDAASGVYATNASGGGIVIENNYFENVQGPYPRGQYVQFNTITGAGNKVTCNVGEQSPIMGGSKEDSLNFYKSAGTAASPIEVSYNKLRGGTSATGCGIMAGDNGGSYESVDHNILVQTGDCGIGVAGGNNMSVTNNQVYSPETSISNLGLMAWGQAGATCSAVTMSSNTVNWTLGNSADGTPGTQNSFWDGGNCGTITGESTNTLDAPIDATIWDTDLSAQCGTVGL